MKNYIIVGMPGSGKTTIGRKAAYLTSMGFIDLDEEIASLHGSITGIFQNEGEGAFRKYETNALAGAVSGDGLIISTGGGIVEKEENRALLKNGTVIFIDRPIENIFKNLDSQSRPLLKDNEAVLHDLYKRRYPVYLEVADHHVINDGAFDDCVENIISIIKNT